MLEVGKVYKNRQWQDVLILCENSTVIYKYLKKFKQANYVISKDAFLGLSEDGDMYGYTTNGCFFHVIDCESENDLIVKTTKTITIDGKDIELSEDSFNSLKRSLLDE